MEGPEQAADVSLKVLPQSIGDAHKRLRRAMETLCLLEDFLLGNQVRDVSEETVKEPPVGVVESCFGNLSKISNSIGECHEQLHNIISRLGVPKKS